MYICTCTYIDMRAWYMCTCTRRVSSVHLEEKEKKRSIARRPDGSLLSPRVLASRRPFGSRSRIQDAKTRYAKLHAELRKYARGFVSFDAIQNTFNDTTPIMSFFFSLFFIFSLTRGYPGPPSNRTSLYVRRRCRKRCI